MKTKQKLSLKRGDLVQVIAGEQKGLLGSILSIDHKKAKAILDTGKVREKYTKTNSENKETSEESSKNETEKIEIPIGIHTSNLMIWDSTLQRVSRIGFKILDNKKQRYFKKSGNLILEDTNNKDDKFKRTV